jgi:serine/threonine protein kinase
VPDADSPRGGSPVDSGEFWASGFEPGVDSSGGDGHLAELRLGDSGEVYVGPLGQDPRWGPDPCRHEPSPPASGAGRLGRFEILERLGEGQHSTVYRAFDPLLERQVALKLPRPGTLASLRTLERFLGEARALAQLRHPRIVPIYEAGCDGACCYIAMELIEGQSLAERIAEGPVPFRRSAEIVRDLAEALAHTHELGIVHRDIKPANIRLDRCGMPCLMDFGIAYRPESGEVPLPPGMILGTPAYVAPEQARGGQPDVLPASDQYSLGAVFYELLCGKPPFLGPPPYVLFHAIHHDPASPRSVQPAVPRPLDTICRRAMTKNPQRRYPSCQALADDLRRWLDSQTSLARWRWASLLF